MFATAALVLTACSNDSDVAVNDASQQAPANAVMFDTYTSSATRAGAAGVMTTTSLQGGDGFGVFATYSDGDDYNSATATPNFMYNQQVTYSSSAWTYSPLKYWPNETVNDSQSPAATGPTGVAKADKLSFFAYAPYVTKAAADADAATGTGIIGMSANNVAGDPTITYKVAPEPENSVDLLWGVAPAGDLSYTPVSGLPAITVPAGEPLVNLVKPDKDQKIKFLFKHALSRIGLKVVGAFDQIAAGGSKDANTKITVDQIDIYGTGEIGVSGVLSLNNATPGVANWTSTTKATGTDPVFTIANGVLNTTIKDGGAVAFASQPEGVTASEKNVFADATKYFMVIPTGNTNITVKIKYYVQTIDANLAASGSVDGSRIENVITKTIPVNLQNNKAYNLKLILGMTSVKLDAEVADWEVDGSTEVYLPQNTAE